MTATRQDLTSVVPLTLIVITILLWASVPGSLRKTGLVLLAVPFSAIGALSAMYLLGYQVRIPVVVGLIALLGIDAGTGVFMLMYLDDAYDPAKRIGTAHTPDGLRRAIVEGASGRIRPKLMTAAALLMGLLPIMWSSGPASEVMKRIAAPMLGGILTSFLLELLVYPLIYHQWRAAQSRTATPGDIYRSGETGIGNSHRDARPASDND